MRDWPVNAAMSEEYIGKYLRVGDLYNLSRTFKSMKSGACGSAEVASDVTDVTQQAITDSALHSSAIALLVAVLFLLIFILLLRSGAWARSKDLLR
nr:MAG: hypothetical protein [Wufeng shrew rhabdovirus 6]